MKALSQVLTALAAACLLLAATAAQSASPIYVWWAQPDDSGDGTSWATAKQTIQAGLDIVDPGGTVIVRAGGDYVQSTTLNINQSLTLQAEIAGDKPVVRVIDAYNSRGLAINSSNVTVQNMHFIQGGTSSESCILYCPKLTHPWPQPGTFQYSDILIDGCIVEGGRRGGILTVENLTVQDSVFTNNYRDSLYLDGVKGGTVTRCCFSGTASKAIIVENTSDGPYSSGTLNVTYNTCTGKGNFFLYDNWPDESSQIALNISHNSVSGTASSAVVLYPAGSSNTIWDKISSFVVRDNAITNAGGLAVYVDYTYYTGTGVPAAGAFDVDHCLGYSNTVEAGDTADPTGNYGYSAGSPPGTSMAMYSLADNLAQLPLWSDPTHANCNFEFLLGSPLQGAASDSTNIGAWQGNPSVDSITPNSGQNTGIMSITDLAGSGFAIGATVKLTKTGQPDIIATNVVVDSSTKITCDFDLTGQALGLWNVVVTNVGGNPVSLDNGFEITSSVLPPVADAGPDQTVPVGPVTLNGSGSYDPQSLPLISYVWKEGPTEIATGVNPTVTMAHGQHTITLTVTNSALLTDSDDTHVLANRPPVAQDQVVAATGGFSEPITLVATDPDGDPLTYTVDALPGHGLLTGTPPNMTYTNTPGYTGPDSFTFHASDPWQDSNTATVSIMVNAPLPPVADAGPSQAIPVAAPVTLDGSGSYDPQGLPITSYVWYDGGTEIATGVNPTVPMAHGMHFITLTVTNSELVTGSAYTTVLVDRPPVANDQSTTMFVGGSKVITLTANDPDGDPLTYQLVTDPSHGTVRGTPPNVIYTPSAYVGIDSFMFKASDGWLDSNAATVSIGLSLRVNCGGATVGDWASDRCFAGGRAARSGATIAGTGAIPGQVYQAQRSGMFSYTIPASIGSHSVKLCFAEIEFGAPRLRLFDVYIQGARVLTNFDIFTAAGGRNRAVTRTFTAVVRNSAGLTISFVPRRLNAMVAGIEVL